MDAKIVCFFIIITVLTDLLKRKIMEELVFWLSFLYQDRVLMMMVLTVAMVVITFAVTIYYSAVKVCFHQLVYVYSRCSRMNADVLFAQSLNGSGSKSAAYHFFHSVFCQELCHYAMSVSG